MRGKTSTRVAIEDQYMSKRLIPILGALMTVGAILAAGLPGISRADITYTVNSTLDQLDDDVLDGICHTAANTCTLRAAVMQANRVSAPAVTISLPAGTFTLTRPVTGSNDEQNGDLDFLTPVIGNAVISVVGAGMSTTIIDANQIDRVIQVYRDRTVRFYSLAIRNGLTNVLGGGINLDQNAAVFMTECAIEGNRAQGGGGAFSGTGALMDLYRSTVSGNLAEGNGGGLDMGGALVLRQSSVERNTGGYGGGILALGDVSIISSAIINNEAEFLGGGMRVGLGAFLMINTTVAGNVSKIDGGGLYMEFTDTIQNIYNSTIAFNGADEDQDLIGKGGGIFVNQGAPSVRFNIYNTIVAGNYVSNSPQPDDCWGIVKTHARNLFGSTNGCTIDQISGSWDFLNSLNFLGPLQNNGGPTQTIALLAGSNAINAGTPGAGCLDNTSTTIATDQRGFPRNVGICDLGAYEFGAIDPDNAIFRNGFES
jgi:hypothetical protein